MNKYTLLTIESWDNMPHKHVKYRENKLTEQAKNSALLRHELPSWEKRGIYPAGNYAFLTHLFFCNVGNFEFSHFYVSATNGGMVKYRTKTKFGETVSGAYAFTSCFYRAFGERPIYAHNMWRHLETLSRTKKFFRGKNHIPMVGERRELLIEACEVLEQYFQGNPWNIWEEGRFRAYGTEISLGVVDILTSFFPKAFGADACMCAERPFIFNKRANLAVMMYQGRAERYSNELPLIEDIAELGPVPDYELPRTYEASGDFEYSATFKELIKEKVPIKRQGPIDLEVRGATVKAQVKELEVKNEIRKEKGLSLLHMGHVDFARWKAGMKSKEGHHVCLTTDY